MASTIRQSARLAIAKQNNIKRGKMSPGLPRGKLTGKSRSAMSPQRRAEQPLLRHGACSASREQKDARGTVSASSLNAHAAYQAKTAEAGASPTVQENEQGEGSPLLENTAVRSRMPGNGEAVRAGVRSPEQANPMEKPKSPSPVTSPSEHAEKREIATALRKPGDEAADPDRYPSSSARRVHRHAEEQGLGNDPSLEAPQHKIVSEAEHKQSNLCKGRVRLYQGL